jgi:hypothetical protein
VSDLGPVDALPQLLASYQRGLKEGHDNDGFSATLVDLVESKAVEARIQSLVHGGGQHRHFEVQRCDGLRYYPAAASDRPTRASGTQGGEMRNKIFGAIGIIWGALVLFHWFTTAPPPSAPPGYAAGGGVAAIFGALMLLAGLYYFFRKSV